MEETVTMDIVLGSNAPEAVEVLSTIFVLASTQLFRRLKQVGNTLCPDENVVLMLMVARV